MIWKSRQTWKSGAIFLVVLWGGGKTASDTVCTSLTSLTSLPTRMGCRSERATARYTASYERWRRYALLSPPSPLLVLLFIKRYTDRAYMYYAWENQNLFLYKKWQRCICGEIALTPYNLYRSHIILVSKRSQAHQPHQLFTFKISIVYVYKNNFVVHSTKSLPKIKNQH